MGNFKSQPHNHIRFNDEVIFNPNNFGRIVEELRDRLQQQSPHDQQSPYGQDQIFLNPIYGGNVCLPTFAQVKKEETFEELAEKLLDLFEKEKTEKAIKELQDEAQRHKEERKLFVLTMADTMRAYLEKNTKVMDEEENYESD